MKATKITIISIIIAITLIALIKADDVEDSSSQQIHYNTETTRDEKTISSTFSEEWESEMSDYEPDYVYMIPLKYKSKEIYYETIETVPVTVRGAYMTADDKEEIIDFEIIDPDNQVIFTKTKNVCIFKLLFIKAGRYKIVFNNRYVNNDLKVTFTMKNGQNEILKKEDLSGSNQKLDNLNNFIEKFDLEFKFNRNIHNDRYKKINKMNKYYYTFSILETVVLISISIWQFYYMRQLFEIKASF